MLTTTLKGAIAETAIIHEATRLGLEAMKPSIEGRRYDLVIDNGHRMLRVQCKWATREGAVIRCRTSTSRLTPAGYVRTTYTSDEIDGFALYCDDNRTCYWLPIEDFAGHSYVHLRLTKPKNNQEQSIRWARDYPFGAVAQLGERSAGSRKVRGSSPLSSIA